MARSTYGDATDDLLEHDEPVKNERKLRDYTGAETLRRGSIDLPFFFLTVIILAIGVVMVLSASFARAYYLYDDPTKYFIRQLIFGFSGIFITLLMSRFPVSFYRRVSIPLLFVSVGMLVLVPFIGMEENGATRWINLGFTTFQPSEIVKLGVIMAFATMICTYRNKMKTFKYGVLPFGIILAVIVGLLYLEPHLSASVIIIAVGAIMMFAGGTPLKWFGIGGAGVLGIGYLTIAKMGYAASRISAWLDPFSDPKGDGWQIVQSLYAIGSGGVLGLGLGQGRQKYLYLPEEHNDFIFSVVCEELGYIGAVLVLLLFALLIVRGFWLALHARDRYGALIVTGITSLLAIQVFFNVGVVTGLLPCTGISLPFFSYGGTALWIQMAEMGIVLAVSREIPLKKRIKE
ncbi:MAG: putative lipid II flippase FtsW [Oscillospiraceae bacterium]